MRYFVIGFRDYNTYYSRPDTAAHGQSDYTDSTLKYQPWLSETDIMLYCDVLERDSAHYTYGTGRRKPIAQEND